MGVVYKSVFGVGVSESEIKFSNLTGYGRDKLHQHFTEELREVWNRAYSETGSIVYDDNTKDYYDEWFADNLYELDIFYVLGLEADTGNSWTGSRGFRGVEVNNSNCTLSNVKDNIDLAAEQFKEVVDLEPVLFSDVSVY